MWSRATQKMGKRKKWVELEQLENCWDGDLIGDMDLVGEVLIWNFNTYNVDSWSFWSHKDESQTSWIRSILLFATKSHLGIWGSKWLISLGLSSSFSWDETKPILIDRTHHLKEINRYFNHCDLFLPRHLDIVYVSHFFTYHDTSFLVTTMGGRYTIDGQQ